MRFNLYLIILFFSLMPWYTWGKGGGGHGSDQMGASDFQGKIHQVKNNVNVALDTPPGSVRGTLNEVGKYGKSAQEASLAGLLQKEGINVPKTCHFNVARGSSHRISTHESFFEGFSRRYLEAAKVANPNISEEVLRKKIDNAFKTMKQNLVTQYENFYKVPPALAEKLAHQDVLIHFWGDYTTSNTIGLPEVESLKKEFLKTVEGLWTPKQIKEFDTVVSKLINSNVSMNVLAERALELTIQNGGTVNKVIMNANGGKVFKNLSQNKLQGVIRSVRWRLEAEMRQKALAFLDINGLTPQDLYALDAIGPNPKAGKANGKLFFSLLDENGLLEKYVKEGLDKGDLDILDKSMAHKGCSPAQRNYVINHPDVKDGCSGREAIKRKAPTLKKAKKLNEYAKKLIKLKSFTNVIARGGKVLPSVSFISEGVDINSATWSKRGKRIFKVGNLRIAKGTRGVIFVEGKTLAEAKKNAGGVVKQLRAAKMAKGVRVVAVSKGLLRLMKGARLVVDLAAEYLIVDAIKGKLELSEADIESSSRTFFISPWQDATSVYQGVFAKETFKDPLASKRNWARGINTFVLIGAAIQGASEGGRIGASVGAFVGTAIPGVGTAVGSAIGAGVGGIIGAVGGIWCLDSVSGKISDGYINKLTNEDSRQKNTFSESYLQRTLLNERMNLLVK